MAENGVAPQEWQGETIYVLHHASGAEARIATSLGANCISLLLGGHFVIESPASPDALRLKPARSGIPILFPYPGRINDATYTFDGVTYHLPRSESGGVHSIHGFVMRHPWQVVDMNATNSATRLVCSISQDALDAEESVGYPFPFRMNVTFELTADMLTLETSVENTGTGPLPFGYGIHPYLLAALSADERKNLLVSVPATNTWQSTDGIPSGQTIDVTSETDLQRGTPLGDRSFDTFYGGVDASSGSTGGVFNPETQRGVAIHADSNFKYWVVFTPPKRPSIALEPYTSAPDAFNLNPRGVDAGLLILPQGETWHSRISIGSISR